MQFQVYNVVIEDRIPRGFSEGAGRDDLAYDDFHRTIKTVTPSKDYDGCVAFVFGRNAEGESVAVRVEGVRPRLFFLMSEGESLAQIRRELEAEVRSHIYRDDTGIHVEERTFCHFYGFEPDSTSASGRKTHRYAEAFYPNMPSWRAACRIRKVGEVRKLKRKLADLRDHVNKLQEEYESLRMSVLSGSTMNTSDAFHESTQKVIDTESQLTSEKERLDALEKRVLASSEGLDEDEITPPPSSTDEGCVVPTVRAAQETFVDPMTRFMQEAGICPSKWTSVPLDEPQHRVTTCDIELQATMNTFTPVANESNAPYRTLYYDIETLGLDPTVTRIIQVSLVFVTDGVRDKHLVGIGIIDPIPDTKVHECEDEQTLLRCMRRLIVENDPDFMVAYNGVNFDNNFLDVRARITTTGGVEEFYYLSRFAFKRCRLRELQLKSSGMGDNLLRYFDTPGRANFDWFVKLRRDLTQEPSYKLNHFAKKFCGDQKEDMHYKEIPILQAGTPQDRARLGSYCVQDSALLHDLDNARAMIVEILQFSNIFGIVPEWVNFRGQQVRFVAQLLHKARVAEAIPLILQRPPEGFSGEGTETFEGATVNVPTRGFHKRPVAVLDWKSLYPSIMMSHNLCHSTFVMDEQLFDVNGVSTHRISDSFVTHFASAEVHKGIMPMILEELMEERTKAKGMVKHHAKLARDFEEGTTEHRHHVGMSKVYDGRQLAIKVAMNSMYGACGTSVEAGAKFPCLAISATVTHEGRQSMVIKKKILPERYPGVEIIYGDTDSIMVIFPGVDDVQECGTLSTEVAAYVTDYFVNVLKWRKMELEFEKAYLPYLLEDKKRYMGLKYEPDGNGTMVCKGIDAKGVETERKDTLPYVKEIMYGVRDAIMYRIDEQEGLRFFENAMDALVRDEVPIEKLILRKTLSGKVEHKTDTIVQARVNALRREREAGSEASTNEQVEYVIVNGHRKERTTFLAEDPVYAREHGLKLNRLWYFEHCIEDALGKMFRLFNTIDYKEVCARYRAKLNAERLGVGDSIRSLLVAGTSSSTSSQNPPPPISIPRAPVEPPRKRRKQPRRA